MENFSVLISVYHKEKGAHLKAALGSVFNQTIPPTEVVLVKDGLLTPELDAVIDSFVAQFNMLKIIPLTQNVGLGNALNEGLKHCKYELVARMDSDDICVPNRFELQLNAFNSNPELAIIGGWISEFENDPSIIISHRKPPQTNDDLYTFLKYKSPFNHMTVMFKKSIITKVGGYKHLYLLEDYWLWARMANSGAKFYNIQSVLVNARGGTAMAARRGGWKYAKSEINLQKKMYQLGLIGPMTFIKNSMIRFTIRMMPNKLRVIIYQKLLRK